MKYFKLAMLAVTASLVALVIVLDKKNNGKCSCGCNCGPDCDCGCQEGGICTCGTDCGCENENNVDSHDIVVEETMF